MDKDLLARNLRALRTARGWTQTQTALAAKIAQTAVSRVERGEGKRDGGKVVRRIAEAFGVTVDRLVHEDLTAAAGRIAEAQPSEPAPMLNAPTARSTTQTIVPTTLESAVFAAVTSRGLPLEVLDASRAVALRVAADLPDGTGAEDAAGAIVEAVQRLRRDGKHPDAVAVLALIAFGPPAVTLHHAVRRLAAGRRLLGYQLARDSGMLDEATLVQKTAEFHGTPPSTVPCGRCFLSLARRWSSTRLWSQPARHSTLQPRRSNGLRARRSHHRPAHETEGHL